MAGQRPGDALPRIRGVNFSLPLQLRSLPKRKGGGEKVLLPGGHAGGEAAPVPGKDEHEGGETADDETEEEAHASERPATLQRLLGLQGQHEGDRDEA